MAYHDKVRFFWCFWRCFLCSHESPGGAGHWPCQHFGSIAFFVPLSFSVDNCLWLFVAYYDLWFYKLKYITVWASQYVFGRKTVSLQFMAVLFLVPLQILEPSKMLHQWRRPRLSEFWFSAGSRSFSPTALAARGGDTVMWIVHVSSRHDIPIYLSSYLCLFLTVPWTSFFQEWFLGCMFGVMQVFEPVPWLLQGDRWHAFETVEHENYRSPESTS